MGWRVGYIAYPDADGSDFLGLQLVKARAARPAASAPPRPAVAPPAGSQSGVSVCRMWFSSCAGRDA